MLCHRCFFIIVSILILHNIDIDPVCFESIKNFRVRVPEMVILGCILLIGLIIGNTYSGGLAALMTVPQ